MRLRGPEGATLAETFTFLSGLYFRGKIAYALHFARPPAGVPGVLVITPNEGLRLHNERVDLDRLARFAQVDIARDDPRYRRPMLRDTKALADHVDPATEIVLLGSIASAKYVDVLTEAFGRRLLFPSSFVGRGDMSRGGLLLRCVRDDNELDYVPVVGAVRHGPRPPRLAPVRWK